MMPGGSTLTVSAQVVAAKIVGESLNLVSIGCVATPMLAARASGVESGVRASRSRAVVRRKYGRHRRGGELR